MRQRFTLKKKERLKSRKGIEQLFKEGKAFSLYPFRVIYLLTPTATSSGSGASTVGPPVDGSAGGSGMPTSGRKETLQAGFGVSARLFRRAVDRNRIKRLTREAWRLERHHLFSHLQKKGLSMGVFLIYTGKQLPDQAVVTQKIGVALQKLMREIA